MKYNPNERDTVYKSFRWTCSSPVVIEAVERIQRETGMSEGEICKEGVIRFLEDKNQIELSK